MKTHNAASKKEDSANYKQMNHPKPQNSERPAEDYTNNTKHKSGEDDDIRLIHEKFKDRITVTRESEKTTMENKRGSVDAQLTQALSGREDDPNKMQSAQPRFEDKVADTDQSLDLTRMTQNELEANNKSQDNSVPKEQIKETHLSG